MKAQLTLYIVCVYAPVGDECNPTVFGLQDKQRVLTKGESIPHDGGFYQKLRLDFAPAGQQRYSDDLTLFQCRVTADTEAQPPDFSGAFVHGTKGKRFLYLSLVFDYRRGDETILKRLKIPLYTIPPEMLNDGAILEITIDGRHVR